VKRFSSLSPVENDFEDQGCALVPLVRKGREDLSMNLRSKVFSFIFRPEMKPKAKRNCLVLSFEDGSREERDPTQVSREQIKKFKGKRNIRGILIDRMV
jgi:hypothetical protein